MSRFRTSVAFAIVTALASPLAAQDSVTVRFAAGTPLKIALQQLREKHDLSIALGVPIGDETVDASFHEVHPRDAATALLAAGGYRYRVVDGGIVAVIQAPTYGGPAIDDRAPLAGAAPTQPMDIAAADQPMDIAVAESIAAGELEKESVKPGINESFLDPGLDVGNYVQRFEGESREVFVHRGRIAAAIGLEPGMAIADIGAGTGLYLDAFARRVGPDGKVFAVDLSPKFIEHLKSRVAERGYQQVEVVRCTEDSAELPPESVDRVFICDTYHHFEYPRSTMMSILRALKPGGELIVVDFDRIPGVSREWLLGHVRAGRDAVCEEIASFGFEFREFVAIEGLRENYVVRFAKPES